MLEVELILSDPQKVDFPECFFSSVVRLVPSIYFFSFADQSDYLIQIVDWQPQHRCQMWAWWTLISYWNFNVRFLNEFEIKSSWFLYWFSLLMTFSIISSKANQNGRFPRVGRYIVLEMIIPHRALACEMQHIFLIATM